jgi:superfamily I DNA/RNA helicase
VIRGAAGSGKTSVAIIRIRQLIGFWLRRRSRLGDQTPVRVLVLTFNRTLSSYVRDLTERNARVPSGTLLELEITTFGKWAKRAVDYRGPVFERENRAAVIRLCGLGVPLDGDFLVDEVSYALGRFHPAALNNYLHLERLGRGRSPRVDSNLKQRIFNEVILPYNQYKEDRGLIDWNDLAVAAGTSIVEPYDVVVIDEGQDFSANQLRAVAAHLATEHSFTLVADTAQKIYPGYLNLREIPLAPRKVHTLKINYRNTRQIATVAAQIVAGLTFDEGGVVPDPTSARGNGPLPQVLIGRFSSQLDAVIDFIKGPSVNLDEESVGFLHLKGGGWFKEIMRRLDSEGLEYVDVQRIEDWPVGSEGIGLSTFHSAKGLEFDHIVAIGLNNEIAGPSLPEHDTAELMRRLIAMGFGRARKTLTFGYRADERPVFMNYVQPASVNEVVLS